MATIKIRYFVTKKGAKGDRHFWWPGKSLSLLKWKGCKLSEIREQALAQAELINTILDAWYAGDAERVLELQAEWAHGSSTAIGHNSRMALPPYILIDVPGIESAKVLPAALPAAPSARTCSALISAFKSSEEFEDLAPKTRKDYGYHLKAIEEWAGDIPVARITRKHIRDWHKAVRTGISLNAANARARVFSLLMSYAVNEEWIGSNPALRLKFKTVKPRVVIWTMEEERALLEACIRADRLSIAALVIAGADIGQRQADLFTMTSAMWDGDRWRMRQGKSGGKSIVYAEPSPRLLKAIADARRRLKELHPSLETTYLFPCEGTGRPWVQSTFNHRFVEIRADAARQCPSLAKKQFRDLRDTAVTRMAISGASLARIRSMTGHTITALHQVLAHYLGTEPELASSTAKHLTALLGQIEAEQKTA